MQIQARVRVSKALEEEPIFTTEDLEVIKELAPVFKEPFKIAVGTILDLGDKKYTVTDISLEANEDTLNSKFGMTMSRIGEAFPYNLIVRITVE